MAHKQLGTLAAPCCQVALPLAIAVVWTCAILALVPEEGRCTLALACQLVALPMLRAFTGALFLATLAPAVAVACTLAIGWVASPSPRAQLFVSWA
jgi:hypothetical protein